MIERSYSLLIVEDEELVRESLSRFFEAQNYIVYQACCGDEGLELYKKHAIDFVVSDIRMPQGDGIELLKNCLRLGREPLAKFIFVTGHSEFSREEILQLGASEVLNKPISKKEILEVLKSLEQEIRQAE